MDHQPELEHSEASIVLSEMTEHHQSMMHGKTKVKTRDSTSFPVNHTVVSYLG